MGVLFFFAIHFSVHSATDCILAPWHTLYGYAVPCFKRAHTRSMARALRINCPVLLCRARNSTPVSDCLVLVTTQHLPRAPAAVQATPLQH